MTCSDPARAPLVRGFGGKCHWLSPHYTTLPVRAAQVTATHCLRVGRRCDHAVTKFAQGEGASVSLHRAL